MAVAARHVKEFRTRLARVSRNCGAEPAPFQRTIREVDDVEAIGHVDDIGLHADLLSFALEHNCTDGGVNGR